MANRLQTLRYHWPRMALGVFGVFLSWNIIKTWMGTPPNMARASDQKIAARHIAGEGDGAAFPERPDGDFVGGNGIVEPVQREAKLAGSVAGRVAQIRVQEGQFVEANAELIRLDTGVEEAALHAAEADLKAAQAELSRTVRGSRAQDVAAAVAEANAAHARSELSAGVLQRLHQASVSGAITRDELDRAQRQADADRFAAEQANARRQVVIEGSRREDVQITQARMMAAEAKRDQAKAALERLIIRAPTAGEVLSIKYRLGELYQPGSGDALVILGDTRQLRVRMDVDERDVGKLALGAKAIMRAPAFAGNDFHGSVVDIGKRMGRKNIRTDDPVERIDTKILEVLIALEDPDAKKLIVGQRVMCYVAIPSNGSPDSHSNIKPNKR